LELVYLKEKLTVLGRLENELRSIRQRIDNEENPVRKAKMFGVYSKMSIALTGKEL
jgi:phosphate-selective porin